jgi:hypothetical protein
VCAEGVRVVDAAVFLEHGKRHGCPVGTDPNLCPSVGKPPPEHPGLVAACITLQHKRGEIFADTQRDGKKWIRRGRNAGTRLALVRRRGETPSLWKARARYSTMGVLPLPPQVMFPTLTTGTGRARRRRSRDEERIRDIRRATEAVERRGRVRARWRKGRRGTAASGVAAGRAMSCLASSIACLKVGVGLYLSGLFREQK